MEIPDNPLKSPKSSPLVFMIFAFLVHAVIGCQDSPVGIADSSIIPDDRFTASSYYDSRYFPRRARLDSASGRGWAPSTNIYSNDYLQIDLGQVIAVCAVATQGANGINEWTKQYKISTSIDNNIWTTYKTGSVDKLFIGNTDQNAVVKNALDATVLLRYIRFIPTTYNNYKVLRVEAYGIRRGCLSGPVGIADTSVIPDNRFTASSYYDHRYAPKNARLGGTTGRGWGPKTTTDPNDYLQIDLGQVFAVCAVATQGAGSRANEWTTQYKISTSVDNNIWNTHKAGSADKLFTGNTDRSTIVKNVLEVPVLLRYIRFIPTTYRNWKVLRVEAHGIRRRCLSSPVGIADTSVIPDNRFTASSYYDHRYAPKNARLGGTTGRGWAPKTTTDPNDYLQIDLGQVLVICAVATQGAIRVNEWTKQYRISTSVDNSIWIAYKSGSTNKLFPGNTNGNTFVKNVLDVPVLLRYIRFIPTTYNSWKVLRVEAYGVHRGLPCASLPVGVGSGKIPDSDMTSSSAYNSTTSPSKARLNYRAGSSWCAATSDSSPYLQINLGSPYIICGISTQGDHKTEQWVESYHMLTSNDGSTFNKYSENSQIRSFSGNFDSSNAVKNVLYDGTVSQYIRVAATSHYGSTNCMRTELYGIQHDGDCTSMPVGISSSSIIPDHRFSASSTYDERYVPSNARLRAANKAWAPKTKYGEWLQIDLGSVVFVCAVSTQGSGYHHQEWTESYKIRISLDNVNWDYYQENNIDKTFTGNTNKDEVVMKSLASPVKAKLIRFYPVTFNNYLSMRVEVYGISSGCSSAFGVEVPGVIQNRQMTSSSNLDNTHNASHGRLYGNSSWCSNTSSNTEYIQINLGQVMTVTGIATQGDHTMNKWVMTYTISYSMDDNLWNTYKDGSNTYKVFQGNSDKKNITVRWLSHPMTARQVRVIPQTWNTAICMRIELYGCDYAIIPEISGLTNQNLTAASNSYVDLVCIVQEPLIQYIKWYTGNTDITSLSTGLVRGANGVKQSTLRVNYTSADDIFNIYDCKGLVCSKVFVCKVMYTNNKTYGIKSADVTVNLDYPSTLAAPTAHKMKSTSVNITWTQQALKASQDRVTKYVLQYQSNTQTQTINVSAPATSHVITGLAVYTDYSVKIKAVSRVGPGRWSVPGNFTTDIAKGTKKKVFSETKVPFCFIDE